MSAEIVAQLKQLIAEQLVADLAIEEIDESEPLIDGGLNLDSVAVVELISLVEDQFGFDFEDDEISMDTFQTLEALANVISAHLPVEAKK